MTVVRIRFSAEWVLHDPPGTGRYCGTMRPWQIGAATICLNADMSRVSDVEDPPGCIISMLPPFSRHRRRVPEAAPSALPPREVPGRNLLRSGGAWPCLHGDATGSPASPPTGCRANLSPGSTGLGAHRPGARPWRSGMDVLAAIGDLLLKISEQAPSIEPE